MHYLRLSVIIKKKTTINGLRRARITSVLKGEEVESLIDKTTF